MICTIIRELHSEADHDLYLQTPCQEAEGFVPERTSRKISLPVTWGQFGLFYWHYHRYYYHNSFTSLSLTRIFHYHWGGIEKQKFSGSPWAISRHILPRRRVSDFFVATLVIALSFYMIMILKKVSWCNLFKSFQAKPSGRYWKMSFQCWLLVKRQKSLLCTV